MEAWLLEFINTVMVNHKPFVYIVFFISSFLQMVFPPHPGDTILLFEGYLIGIKAFGFVPVFLTSITATFAGSYCIFNLGYAKGHKVFEYRLINQFVSVRNRERTQKLFEKYGPYIIAVSKFVMGLNAVILLFAGIFKIKKHIAYSSMLVAILIHHTLYLILGRLLGDNIQSIKKILSTYNSIVIILLLLTIGAYLLVKYLKAKAKTGVD